MPQEDLAILLTALRQRADALVNLHPPPESVEIIHDLFDLANDLQDDRCRLQRMQDRLRRQRNQLESAFFEFNQLFDHAPVTILTLDPDSQILQTNRTGIDFLGQESVRNQASFQRIVRPEFRDRFKALLADVLETGQGKELELQVSDTKGQARWMALTAVKPPLSRNDPVFDRDVCMISLTDITPLKAVQRELRDNEEQSRAVLEAMREGMVVFNRQGVIEEANNSACRLFGRHRAELLHQNIGDILPAFEGELMDRIQEAVRRSGTFETIASLRLKEGKLRRISFNCVMFMYRGKPHTLALAHDIEDRLQAERELNRAAVVFEQSNEGIMIADEDHQILMVNDAATSFFNSPRDEILGCSFFSLMCDNEVLSHAAILDSLMENGKWSGEIPMRRSSGENFLAWMSMVQVFDPDSQDQTYIALFHDLTEHRRAEHRIRQLAHFDPLTGLPNRALFQDRLDQALTHAQRENSQVALLFLDLDNFKAINDSLGHQAGDHLLNEVADRLRGCVRSEDTIARMGGDEFTILLGDLASEKVAQRIAARVCGLVLETFDEPIQRGGHEMFTDGSIGIALYPRDAERSEDLVRCADTAMYAAKKAGKGRCKFFSDGMDRQARQRLELETGLRRALQQNELRVHYQPIVDAADGRLRGLEALLRWEQADGRVLDPGNFIEVAEETGIIVPIGHRVFEEVCRMGRSLLDQGQDPGRLGVNVSSRQLMESHFLEFVSGVLNESGLPPENLEIEVCERTILDDMETSCRILNQLRELGVTVALDDFGTGYSSLRYLTQLPIDKLKIDRGFIANMENDPQDQAIVRTIIELAKDLGLTVVAEGVEREAQARWLRENGCHQMQGFWFGRPMPGNEAREAMG